MKMFIHLQHLEHSLLKTVLSISACWKYCLEDFQNLCIIRYLFYCLIFYLFKIVRISIYTEQAIKKVSKFVKTNILPGAIAEVGLLCCACIHSNPELAVNHLVEPLLSSVISSLKGIPLTGFGGSGNFTSQSSNKVSFGTLNNMWYV